MFYWSHACKQFTAGHVLVDSTSLNLFLCGIQHTTWLHYAADPILVYSTSLVIYWFTVHYWLFICIQHATDYITSCIKYITRHILVYSTPLGVVPYLFTVHNWPHTCKQCITGHLLVYSKSMVTYLHKVCTSLVTTCIQFTTSHIFAYGTPMVTYLYTVHP